MASLILRPIDQDERYTSMVSMNFGKAVPANVYKIVD